MSEFNEATLLEITDMLTTATENVEKVYGAGHSKGYQTGYTVGHQDGDESYYNQGYDAGKQAEYDAFWDAFQNNKGNYQYTFCNYAWNDETFKPKYDIVFGRGYSGTNAFWGSYMTNIAESLEKLGRKMDTTLCGYWSSMFQGAKTKRIPELNCTYASEYNADYGLHNTFLNCELLETIDKMIVPEALKYTNTFNGCVNLKNIVFEGVIGENISFQWSTKLSWGSIWNIADHLSATTSGKTLTLSQAAVDEAFKYDMSYCDDAGNWVEYWIIGSEAGGWIEICDTHPNWTITLI